MGLCASSNPDAVSANDLRGLKRKEKLHLVFKHLDANGNGVLTLDEMLTTAAHLNNAEVKAIQDEFEELDKDHNYVLHENEFISKHIMAYKDLPDKQFDEWVIDVCKLHEHTEEELKKFGIHKSSASFLGGVPEEIQEKAKRDERKKLEKEKLLLEKSKKDNQNRKLLNELHHLEEDINTVVHKHAADSKSNSDNSNVQKIKRKKNNAYVIDAEIGKLQDQIANLDLLADDEDVEDGDGHKHHHHHHHHRESSSNQSHHHHRHHHHHHHHHKHHKSGGNEAST